MFKRTKEPDELDDLIAEVYRFMQLVSEDSEEYSAALTSLERLEKLRDRKKSSKSIDRNAALTVGGNLAGILMILAYEHTHVITSKAFGTFVKREGLPKRSGI